WLAAALIGGAVLVVEAVDLARRPDDAEMRRAAWRFYRHNSIYVAVLLTTLIAERIVVYSIH
ncbi:MAG: hypothetical protein KDJ18_09255, partial [Hyphomicrobiaceae bacterium]|nr:hypothetical protein [Hyphomicrobiaceae bacterium]